ncbi:N-lysine methyltransferase KMT5A-A-like [Thalassophryne amazonica]|uniref:N-lysine methyltransferase KMT5A-A-like n=1 Tax=Thalassophryne amazonica TaxID=390379 RepID=UPI001471731F|nr:N-lysine methyltransferase KMT5A-A-like [Thalassophryne amazonica]
MPPRLTPLKDACQHVGSKTDKTQKLEVKFINAVKGRGLFAAGSFCKGEFVVEYRGDLVDDAEAERRRKVYHPSCAAFFFLFKWRGKTWCIDASREDDSYGRLVNDEHIHPNCHIKENEEITYDYGGDDCPWRMQMTLCTMGNNPVKSSHPSAMSEKQMEEAVFSQDIPQQPLQPLEVGF